MSKFTLMNKNKKIFDFEYNDEEHLITRFERNYKENEDYAPFGLIKDDNIDKSGFNKWWKNRQIPASRNGLKEVLHKSDIYDKDNFDLSLNTKFEKAFNYENNLDDKFINIVREELNKYV